MLGVETLVKRYCPYLPLYTLSRQHFSNRQRVTAWRLSVTTMAMQQVLQNWIQKGGTVTGVDDAALGWLCAQTAANQPVCILARDHAHMQQLAREVSFFAPKLNIVTLPAWDVQPYDRLAPDPAIQAERVAAIGALQASTVQVVVTTVNAISTRLSGVTIPPLVFQQGKNYPREAAIHQLISLGYTRTGTVTEPGEFSVRGEVMDIYPPTYTEPVRLDFFDDELETLKYFDPVSQRSGEALKKLTVVAASEIVLDENNIRAFREGYRQHFQNAVEDQLYTQVSEGIFPPLAMHYLPLFYEERMPSLFDLLPENTGIIAPDTWKNALQTRQESIADAYETRLRLLAEDDEANAYRPLAPEYLYLTEGDWLRWQQRFTWHGIQTFDDASGVESLKLQGHHLGNTLQERLKTAVSLFQQAQKSKKKMVLVGQTKAGLTQLEKALNSQNEAVLNQVELTIGPLAKGFITDACTYITEQDIFGQRQEAATRKRKREGAAIAHFSDLAPGDYVVHDDHGVARFEGLVAMDVGEGTQDFLKLVYAGDDRVYVPVEALNLISRYSSAEAGTTTLDKLGGAAWQARKARVKKDLMAMAGELMKTAAARNLLEKDPLPKPPGLYDDFCATFPYQPTSEQQSAIDAVLDDLSENHPMDRLVVGDVGFGKTEVALRAAMVAVGNGKQVAVVVPTTLLARQHFEVFSRRFAGFPINVVQLSRMVSAKQVKENKTGLTEGKVDIVIGTHALLAKDIRFSKLGLLVIDEEQRFGVGHKEKLKQLKANVDVLTLTATPIPRTLHMAMGGLKKLSTINTPPVDRLAVRNYVLQFDPKVVREAILREIHRGGQVYVVTPRVQDIQKLQETLEKLVPEAAALVAHGQMPEGELEQVMHDFYEGKFQVLIATTIIESGIDVPRANTLIVNRADRFGLSQLHQLRGRVGRSTARAYAYFILPEGTIGEMAERRLRILQRLEGLGAGFQLASFDMDLRGAGNLVGKEQSGHLQDVGFELYSKLLAEAVAELKAEKEGLAQVQQGIFTPTLNLGISYLLPEKYVPDLATRMQLYRRLASVEEMAALFSFEEELVDRFGALPPETKRLIQVVAIRNRCGALNIDKLEAGPRGCVIRFYQNTFSSPENLLVYVQQNASVLTLNPDQTLTFHRAWGASTEKRMLGIELILTELETLLKNS